MLKVLEGYSLRKYNYKQKILVNFGGLIFSEATSFYSNNHSRIDNHDRCNQFLRIVNINSSTILFYRITIVLIVIFEATQIDFLFVDRYNSLNSQSYSIN